MSTREKVPKGSPKEASDPRSKAAFAGRLRSLGYTPQQLAKIADVDVTNAYRWLDAKARAQPSNAKAVAADAAVSWRWLLYGEEPREAEAPPVVRRRTQEEFLSREASPVMPPLTPEQADEARQRRYQRTKGKAPAGAPAGAPAESTGAGTPDAGARFTEVDGMPAFYVYATVIDGQLDRYVVEVVPGGEVPRLEIGDALRQAHTRGA